MYYIPRRSYNQDNVFTEDPLNKFTDAYPLEMYMSNVDGFQGERDLLTKFGVEFRDTATFIVSKRRWEETVATQGNVQLTTRPAEGDVIYFPLTKAYFEITRVDPLDPFFQVGSLYVFKLSCELMRYSSEVFDTKVNEIDQQTAEKSLDLNAFNILLENESRLLLEYYSESSLINEEYSLDIIIPGATNDEFSKNIDILDFTERNPFGEII